MRTNRPPVNTADEPDGHAPGKHTRRHVIGKGVKLVFVAPVVSTLFPQEVAAASGLSCAPAGSPCAQDADCCSNTCDTLGDNICLAAF